ncbi:MAG: hypothetical protein ACFFB0_17940 [Promethearchaeota archaeon]
MIQETNFEPNITNKELKLYVKSQVFNPIHQNGVVQLIKKNGVIKQLSGGKCITCRKIVARDNLPTQHFHHRYKKKHI